ncbi:MAG: hypothetical protein JW809_11465 [Pirellulales bacterium]|nr:hypothetical protein [Pirellulales bacterium]
MAIRVTCSCGYALVARDEFAGKRGRCPYCGEVLTVPAAPEQPAPGPTPPPQRERPAAPGPTPPPQREQPADIKEFLDPPAPGPKHKNARKAISLRPMFDALLDPRSIQWMLILGGGLLVLGLVVWLTSLGIFERRVVLVAALATGTLVVLLAGWFVALRTRFKIAGQALTFLGCVIAPLNLWVLHAQGLVLLENHLWMGGVVCSLLYIATVYVLRDPLFVYAVEAGLTLTALLFLAELGLAGDTSHLCLVLMAMGLVSIHAERAFPGEGGPFTRRRFGMPLFWSGHAQMGAALAILLASQVVAWLIDPARQLWPLEWSGNWMTQNFLLAGGLWLAGTYAYVYSDLVVRRVGVYCCLAAFCLVMAEMTVAGANMDSEGLILVLALTGLAASLAQSHATTTVEKIRRMLLPLAMAMSVLPLLMGVLLHLRATSSPVAQLLSGHETGWMFVAAMLAVAIGNRISAFLCRHTAPAWSAAFFFLSGSATVVAAASLLRVLGIDRWSQQAPLLMLLPVAYLVASRLWRGYTPERPLGWIAHATTAVILLHVVVGSLETIESAVRPIKEDPENLLLGLVFVEAAAFYTLAAIFRRRSANVYFATLSACGALWELLGYWGVPGAYYTMLYAALGVGFLAVCRLLGVEQKTVYRPLGERRQTTQGRGLAAFQMGNAILSVAMLAALCQGLARLAVRSPDVLDVWALLWTILAGLIGAALAPGGVWRRAYVVASIALAAVMFLTLNVLIDLNRWQKLEIFCVAAGIGLIVAGYVGRFREEDNRENDMVTAGLWLGSILAVVPLLIALVHHRFGGDHVSAPDELGILAVGLLLLVTGFSWQVKSTTLLGGSGLALYVLMVLVALGWRQQVAVGVYLAIGGGILFALGVGLSVYREKLLRLPEQIAKREGMFQILNWR